MHPRIGTSSTKYTTDKTRTPDARYNYEPEHLGCIKFLYDLCTTTVAKTGPTSTPTTCVPLPSTLEDSVDVKFLAVTPNIYGMCATTKRVPLLPPPSRERLLPL